MVHIRLHLFLPHQLHQPQIAVKIRFVRNPHRIALQSGEYSSAINNMENIALQSTTREYTWQSTTWRAGSKQSPAQRAIAIKQRATLCAKVRYWTEWQKSKQKQQSKEKQDESRTSGLCSWTNLTNQSKHSCELEEGRCRFNSCVPLPNNHFCD